MYSILVEYSRVRDFFLRIDYNMYNNEDISKLFLVFKLAKFMLGNYTVLNLQIFELLIVFYSIFYASTLTTLLTYVLV